MTSSNIKPDAFIIGANSTIINYGLTEETVDGVTTYSYYSQKYPATDQVALDRMKAKLESRAAKIAADKALADMVVDANSVPFDAGSASINYMSSVLAVANFKYVQAIANGATPADAYATVYKTTVNWKNANNTVSNVQVETVAKALEAAMTEVGTIKTTN